MRKWKKPLDLFPFYLYPFTVWMLLSVWLVLLGAGCLREVSVLWMQSAIAAHLQWTVTTPPSVNLMFNQGCDLGSKQWGISHSSHFIVLLQLLPLSKPVFVWRQWNNWVGRLQPSLKRKASITLSKLPLLRILLVNWEGFSSPRFSAPDMRWYLGTQIWADAW